ncbi:MAG: LysR family transcriptional regulator [Luteimonas sp.]|nr:LysR family transcriptional regulator [Luteimonas sp.]
MDLLLHLRIFQRVAEAGSFSRAAEQLGLAPSSVSAAVQKLERHLGARLLQRTTRRVHASSDGALLLARCRTFLNDAGEVEQLFRSGERPAGLLRVEVPARMARLQIAPALPGFLAAYPGASIDFGGSDRITDLVGEGIDCALRVGDPGDVNLAARSLGQLRHATCAAPALLARHPPVRRVTDLAALPAIHFGRHPLTRREPFEFLVGDVPVVQPMQGRVAVGNAETYIACALAGLGVIQVPRYDVVDQLRDGSLVELLPQYPPPSQPLNALYPAQHRGSRLLHAFIDWLEALMAPYVER